MNEESGFGDAVAYLEGNGLLFGLTGWQQAESLMGHAFGAVVVEGRSGAWTAFRDANAAAERRMANAMRTSFWVHD